VWQSSTPSFDLAPLLCMMHKGTVPIYLSINGSTADKKDLVMLGLCALLFLHQKSNFESPTGLLYIHDTTLTDSTSFNVAREPDGRLCATRIAPHPRCADRRFNIIVPFISNALLSLPRLSLTLTCSYPSLEHSLWYYNWSGA